MLWCTRLQMWSPSSQKARKPKHLLCSRLPLKATPILGSSRGRSLSSPSPRNHVTWGWDHGILEQPQRQRQQEPLSPAHHAEPRQCPAFSRQVCSCHKGFAVRQCICFNGTSSLPARGGSVLLESCPFPSCFGSHSQKKYITKLDYITKTFKPTRVLPLHPH